MDIIKGKIPCAKKVVIYGPEGIGKSTLASHFPDPVFSDTEGSTNSMDVARFPKPSSWQMLKDQIAYVKANPSCCKTYVIDTIDWAEQMCIESICAQHQKKGIEDFGYGNGYVYVKEEFGRFLNSLSEVVEKGVNVVLTAHAQMRKFEQPDELGAYDRWELKLGKKTSSQTSPLVKEWADILLFCNYKTIVVNVDGQGAQKGKNKAQGGRRVMYTSHHACWDAKNRYGLPDELPMEYSAIAHVIEQSDIPAPKAEPEKAPEATAAPPEKPAAAPKQEAVPKMPAEGPDVKQWMRNEDYTEKSFPEPQAPQKVPDPPVEKPALPETGVSRYFSDPEKIPKALRDLMEANDVGEWDIQMAVTARGYYPEGTLIENYQPAFIDGVLIGAWPQVLAMVKEIKAKEAIPFD